MKRCVFNCFLNAERESVLRRERGREFHVVGAETEKDFLPQDWRENRGVERRSASCDLSVLEGW